MTGGGISQLPLYDTAQADISTESSLVLRFNDLCISLL